MRVNVWRKSFDGMNILLGSIPFKIKFEVGMQDRWETLGQIDYYNNIVHLDPDLHERDMLTTVLHELIEFINRSQEIGLTHHVITVLETSLMQIITQNPHLFRIYVDEAERDIFENVGDKENEEAKVTTA